MSLVPNHRGSIVIGSTESDAHVVSIYLIALNVEQNGFQAENMRCFNSAAAFVDKARETDARAIVISNQNGSAYDDLVGLADALAGSGVPVILGGHYYVGVGEATEHEARLREVGVTHFTSSIEDLMVLLETLA